MWLCVLLYNVTVLMCLGRHISSRQFTEFEPVYRHAVTSSGELILVASVQTPAIRVLDDRGEDITEISHSALHLSSDDRIQGIHWCGGVLHVLVGDGLWDVLSLHAYTVSTAQCRLLTSQ